MPIDLRFVDCIPIISSLSSHVFTTGGSVYFGKYPLNVAARYFARPSLPGGEALSGQCYCCKFHSVLQSRTSGPNGPGGYLGTSALDLMISTCLQNHPILFEMTA